MLKSKLVGRSFPPDNNNNLCLSCEHDVFLEDLFVLYAFHNPQTHSCLFCILQQCDPEKLITESKFLQLESLQELMKVREILSKGLGGSGTNVLCMIVDMCCVLI